MFRIHVGKYCTYIRHKCGYYLFKDLRCHGCGQKIPFFAYKILEKQIKERGMSLHLLGSRWDEQ